MRLVRISSVIIIFFLIFTSCQDDPTSLGKDLIDKEVQIKEFNSITESIPQTTSSFVADSISLGRSTKILLGNLDYVKSTILFRFGAILADSIQNDLDSSNLKVLSATVELRPNYKIGNVSQQFNFSAHEVTSAWGTTHFTSDSLALLSYEPGELTDSKQITDSLITFNVDTTLALTWLQAMAGDSLSNNYGIVLLPESGTNLIYGFRAFTGSVYDDSPILSYVVKNKDNKIDTIQTIATFDTHILEGTPPSVSDDRMQLVAGLAERGKLFFDLSEFPKNVNINKAELTLTVDTLSSVIGSPDTDSLRVHSFADSVQNTINTDVRIVRLRYNDNIFIGNVTTLIQSIVSGVENQGFRLVLDNELDAVGKYVIYGSKYSDVSLRPKLVIYYNELN